MTSHPFTYSVEKEPPEHVREQLCRLWLDNLKLAEGAEQKFRWLYRDAPLAAETVFMLRAHDPEGGVRAVGTNGVAVRRYQVARDGREGKAGVCGDLAVDLAHRGLLPALRLVRAVHAYTAEQFDLAYGFPNKKAEGVMLRAGFRLLGKARRRARVLRHARYVARIRERGNVPEPLARLLANPVASKIVGGVVDVVRLGVSLPRVTRVRARYVFAWESCFDGRFDVLWQDARSLYDVVGARTSEFLSWRYPACEIATISDRRSGRLSAYAIVEHDRASKTAHLRDVFGHVDALEPLVDCLLPALFLRGAASVSVSFLGAPRLAQLLEARGFEVRDDDRTIVVQVGRQAADLAHVLDESRWHLFDVDEDT